MPNTYNQGSVARLTGTFVDSLNSNAALDPEAVNITIEQPDGTQETYVYGTHDQVVKSATGIYYIDVDLDSDGAWYYRWWSTGVGKAADWECIQVRRAKAS